MRKILCLTLLCCMAVSSAHTGGDDGIAIRRRVVPANGMIVWFPLMVGLSAFGLIKGIKDWRESKKAKTNHSLQSIQKDMDGDRAPLLIVFGGICALVSAGCGWLLWNNYKLRDIPILKVDGNGVTYNPSCSDQKFCEWDKIGYCSVVRIPDGRGRTAGYALCFCKNLALVSQPEIVLDLREAKYSKRDAEDLAREINGALTDNNCQKIITLLAAFFSPDPVT